MTQEQQERVFEAFEQADNSTSRRFGGTGLGLSISKTLVELMQGTISISSEENRGSVFSVCWPKEESPIVLEEQDNPDFSDVKMMVLVKDALVRKMTVSCLTRLKVDFEIVENAQNIAEQNQVSQAVLYLVDEPLLKNDILLNALQAIASKVTVMTLLTSDNEKCPLKAADFISKPLLRSSIQQTILHQLGRTLSNEQELTPSQFANLYAFKAKILLVEDSKTNQEVASNMLAMFGCIPYIAENGEEAVDRIINNNYDLVLMDCQMPVMDGYTATREIRLWEQQGDRTALKIVALTAGMGMNYRQDCLNAGMDECMLKPFSSKQILEILNKYLGHLLVNKEPVKAADSELPIKPEAPSASHEDTEDWLDIEIIAAIRQIEKQTGRKMLQRLLDMFEQEMQQKLLEIKAAYSKQDAPRVAEIAHAMKSLTGNVGAKKLRVHCHVIEQAGIDDDLPCCEKSINALEPCYIESMQRLSVLAQE
jgi:CheY-like chemotaxis protein/HPt (histidine-containing phosphotransfer) domain-containing protein